MLVDERLDAALHTMFMVEYGPDGSAHPHDHPLEEAYYVSEGEVEAWADDSVYLMQPGDFLWTGVGCTHAFYNKSDTTARWLESQSPQPPVRNSYRLAANFRAMQSATTPLWDQPILGGVFGAMANFPRQIFIIPVL